MGKLKDATRMDDIEKLEALENTRDHWQWLADNPKSAKDEYPGLKDLNISHDCFLCEYTGYSVDDESVCIHCPLRGYAWEKECYTWKTENFSLYTFWLNARYPEEKTKFALLMVQNCNLAIKDLEAEYNG